MTVYKYDVKNKYSLSYVFYFEQNVIYIMLKIFPKNIFPKDVDK